PGFELHCHGKLAFVCLLKLLHLLFESFAPLSSTIGGIGLAYHEREARVPQAQRRNRAVRRSRRTRVDGRKAIWRFRADVEGAVAAVRIADQEDLIRVDVTKNGELANEIRNKRRDVLVVEAVPRVVGRSQG